MNAQLKNKIFFFLTTMVMSALAVTSCSSDNDESTHSANIDPVVKESTIELTSNEATTQETSFDATETWQAISNNDWVTITPKQGIAGANRKITLAIAENLTTDARTTLVTIATVQESKAIAKITIKQAGRTVVETGDENQAAPIGMKKNAGGLVKAIKVGWNLGNTCESSPWEGWTGNDIDIETLWGNPKTTLEMITALKHAGFNAIRIPTRWCVHADADLNINASWMNRIKEIVDYAVNQDMYVILNSHHDNWYDRRAIGVTAASVGTKFKNMWTQIATAFKDYDEHLTFGATNEVIKLNADGTESWDNPNADDMDYTNELMQMFVDAVRATGGNNRWRCLLVQPWAASPSNALNDGFKLPADATAHRLLLEYHCYDPYHYAIGKDLPDNKYAQHEFKEADKQAMLTLFSRINAKFVETGTPVIMAEFGSTQDNSYTGGNAKADQIRADYLQFMVSETKRYNIPGFYWDNNAFDGKGENFGLLDRKTATFPTRAQIALNGIMSGLK